MHAWEAIQKTLDYIELHLDEDIDLGTLAQIANLSPFYFQRLFARLVKKPPREYIRLRQLAAACALLANGGARILDVALQCGFGSHEAFTRAFKNAYGITPEQYRAAKPALNQFDKPDLLLNYVAIDEGVPLIGEGIVLEYNRRTLEQPILFVGFEGFVPIEGQMPLGEATGIDVPGEIWEKFHKEKHLLPKLPGGRELGVAYMGSAPAGSFTYFAGTEALPNAVTTGFATWELPVREYIVCGFEAESFAELTTVALNKAVKYSASWLERHNLSMEVYSPEVYYDSAPAGRYMELWMPFVEK